jgi:tetratricopeptide (TPR) repeat protein
MDIPSYLEQQVQSGKTVLILGAGASLEARDCNNRRAPRTDELRDMLSEKFLGGKLKNRGLSQVAEYAISESNLIVVQEFIRQQFEGLRPTEAHDLLPTFRWWGLATTNYDRLIETAYANAKSPVQALVPFAENGELIDTYTRDPNNVLLLKLHGCITKTASVDCPLILTVDQYIDHKAGRSRVFDQLTDWGFEHVFVFIGHSLQDTDIRQLLKDLTQNAAARARFFCVVPDADEIEKRTLEQQRITVLTGTFDDFMKTLDSRIAAAARHISLAPPTSGLPVADQFKDRSAIPSKNVAQFFAVDADYVNAISGVAIVSAKDFYKGFNPGFSAIEQRLDVPRRLADQITTDVFLADESEHAEKTELVVLKAHAGAGKTVLMRRLAWDAAREYGCFCIYMRSTGVVNVPALQELLELSRKRIYLFVDDAADRVRELESLFKNIGPSGAHLTVVVAERMNEWNVSCQAIDPRVTDQYELRYLTPGEIDVLIGLLEKHKADGKLHGRSFDQKRAEFEEKAGRQLLVALHEATEGSPFQDIIKNEFDNIWPSNAKQIYLTICCLNRLNVPVRAGIISRIHGVPFDEFRKHLFHPLEHIVQTEFDEPTRDYMYRARHPHIAEMVFELVLPKQEDKFDAYMRCLGALNIDYSTDRIAFRQMTRAKTVLDLFSDHQIASSVYTRALERAGEKDGTLIHQIALYELNRPNGNLDRAAELLAKAYDLRTFDITIMHSKAELHLKLAESSRTSLEKEKHLRDAKAICIDYNRGANGQTYGYVTLAKIGLARLEESLNSADAVNIEQSVKEIEAALQDGFQRSPDDSYLREAESRFAEMIEDSERATKALEKALKTNPRNGFIANRLAQLYRKTKQLDKAKSVLTSALAANGNDRRLQFAYAKLLIDTDGSSDEVLYHLQRSFISGDTNYEAQLLYGRQLFLNGKITEAKAIFKTLKSVAISPNIKFKLYFPLREQFHGEIVRIETTYCFIARDGIGDWIYAHRDNYGELWEPLHLKQRVTFRVAFSFGGPNAFDVGAEG